MTSTSTTLYWSGPFSLTGTDATNLWTAPEGLESGIYIWTLQVHGARWVYYIGETGKSFIQRHLEHIANYYDGQNRVYNPRALAKGRQVIVWDWALGPGERRRRARFRSRFNQLAPHVQRSLSLFRIFLIPLNATARMRERLEAALWRLPELHGASKFQEDGIRFRPCRPGERQLVFRFMRPLPIKGLSQVRAVALPLANVAA